MVYLFTHDVHGLHDAAGDEAVVAGQDHGLLQGHAQGAPAWTQHRLQVTPGLLGNGVHQSSATACCRMAESSDYIETESSPLAYWPKGMNMECQSFLVRLTAVDEWSALQWVCVCTVAVGGVATDLCMPVAHMVTWHAPRRLQSSEETLSTLTPDGWPPALGRTLT